MGFERRRLSRPAGFELLPLAGGALQEQGGHSGCDRPIASQGRLVEEVTVATSGREQLHVLEALEVHTQAARILEEQFRMWPACNEPAGLLLVNVGNELSASRSDRTAHV